MCMSVCVHVCHSRLANQNPVFLRFRESVDRGKLAVSELGYPSFTVDDFHENVRDTQHSCRSAGCGHSLPLYFLSLWKLSTHLKQRE